MKIEDKLAARDLRLPAMPKPVANYVRTVRTGNLLFVSGHGPSRDGTMQYIGKVGRDLTVEEGYQAAQLVALNCLASDLLVDLYGDAGRHARSAVGMGSLPQNMAVEIEMILKVE